MGWGCRLEEDENYREDYDSKEEAIAKFPNDAALGLGTKFYVAEYICYEPEIDAESILENIRDAALEDVGDPAEGFLSEVSGEAQTELHIAMNVVLAGWMRRNNQEPDFYLVDEDSVQEHTFTSPD